MASKNGNGLCLIKQVLQVQAALFTNVAWESNPVSTMALQQAIDGAPNGGGAEFVKFLRQGGRVEKPKLLRPCRINILKEIEERFDEGSFTFWMGPGNGDGLHGDDRQDQNSLALTEIAVDTVTLCSIEYRPGLKVVDNHIKLVDACRICLDAGFWLAILKDPFLFPASWKETRDGGCITRVHFNGTIFRSTDGFPMILWMSWVDGGLKWGLSWARDEWKCGDVSASLPKAKK